MKVSFNMELLWITRLLTINVLWHSLLRFEWMVNIGDICKMTKEDLKEDCAFINTHNHSPTKQLTLFWLTFPVHEVDDITALQHVRLLLDQFGHVNHSAISATDKQKEASSLFQTHFSSSILLFYLNFWISTAPYKHYYLIWSTWHKDNFSKKYLMSSSHTTPELSSWKILQCSPETSLLAGKDR